MKDWPNAFWAVLIIALSVIVALSSLLSHAEKEIKITIIGFAASLASGAFGYIQGRKETTGGVSVTATGPDAPSGPPASATATIEPKE